MIGQNLSLDLSVNYDQVVLKFVEFKFSNKNECPITSLNKLSELICLLKIYHYENDMGFQWKSLVSYLYNKNDAFLYIDYQDLEENFKRTLDSHSIYHWDNITLFLMETNQFVKNYNLTLKDLIKASTYYEPT